MPQLFALDQNFPEPIINALNEFIPEADLVPLEEISPLLVADTDDWEILLALHHHARPWDGLITNDRMLGLPREMAVVRQTRLTLVVTLGAGHDPILATGLLFAHLAYICEHTSRERGQIWPLAANTGAARDPWFYLERIADHQNREVGDVWNEGRLTHAELAVDPLALG